MSDYRKIPNEVVLGGRFLQPSYSMVSADPGKSDVWHKTVGKSGKLWLYHPEKSRVWVDGGPGSEGCGGRTLTFTLANDEGTVDLKGPWCSNADACFADTGVDVRQNFITWGCVGTERFYDENTRRSGIGNLIWFDSEPTKGAFDRVDFLAWELQEKNPDQKLYLYWESEGGSSMGPVHMPYKLRVARGLQRPIDF